MAKAPKAQTRGRSSGLGFFFVLLLLVLGAAGALGTIYVLGDMKLPFLGRVEAKDKEKVEDHTGLVRVPLSTRAIAAYTMVEYGSLFDARTQSFSYSWMSPERVKDLGVITDISQLLGRVMARDKQPTYSFTESDFLPKGTHAGPAAGIEPGRRGRYVSTKQVQGLAGLKRGDRFDLMASRPDNSRSDSERGVYVDPSVAETKADAKRWDAPSKIIVQNGKIIVPLQEGKATGPNVDEVFISVKEDEIEPLSGAIDLGAKITCLARSGQPGGEDGVLPEPDAPPPTSGIKVFNGSKSESAYPKSGSTDAQGKPDGGSASTPSDAGKTPKK